MSNMVNDTDGQSSVRTLDFDLFLNGNEGQKQAFCWELAHALGNIGFVKLVNHGIAPSDIEKVFDMVSSIHVSQNFQLPDKRSMQNARFFGLSGEAKSKAAHAVQPNPHRGYSYVGQEKLSRVRDFEKGHLEDVEVLDVKVCC